MEAAAGETGRSFFCGDGYVACSLALTHATVAPMSLRQSNRYSAYAAITLVIVLLAFALAPTPRAPTAVVSDDVGLTSRADSVAMARVIGRLLAAESDSAVQTLRAFARYDAAWSPAARRRASDIEKQRGLAHFTAGRQAFEASRWAEATRELAWAVTYGSGSEYHANAMYLLARTHARTGQPASARLEAQELLRQYPQSRFADALIRRVAATGSEK